MNKVALEIVGLSTTQAGNSAYALLLNEAEGKRRIPIVIGAFEAQAIALELEGVRPPRPMTHDLFKNLIDKFGASVSEVYINDLHEGTFYSQIVLDSVGFEIDARPSDAIAVAVRFGAPIFIREDILEETAIIPHPEDLESEEEFKSRQNTNFGGLGRNERPQKSKIDSLNEELSIAIENEDYERAAQIRDEINNISNLGNEDISN